MTPALRIIIIEDSPDDALLVVREVERAGYTVESQRIQTAEELRDALAQGTWDLILADYSLPHFSAPEGLSILWETGLDVPFIVVSGSIGEETAVQLMRDGTTDYVMKDHLSRLGPVVQRELHDADERRHKRDAERALAESEKRYRLLVESQTDLIVKTDPDGRLLYANSTYCTLFGKSLEEMTGSGYQPHVHPGDLPSVKRAVAALSRPPHSCRYEARTMTTDGWRCIEWDASTELDSKGMVVAIINSGRDITERKRTKEAIDSLSKKVRAEKELQSLLLTSMNDEVWFADTSGHFTLANPAACKAFSVESAGDIDIQRFAQSLEVLRPDGTPRPVEEAPPLRALAGEVVLDQEEIVRLPISGDLRYRLVNSTPVRDAQGTIIGCVSVVRDITERKHVEDKLRTSESDLRQAQAVAHVGSWRWDINSDRLIWSDEMFRIFGIPPEEFSGSWKAVIARFVHPDDRAKVESANSAVIKDQELGSIEYRIVRPDGSVHTLLDRTGEMALDSKGRPSVLIGVVLDITDRRRAEAEKEAMQAQLVQAQKMDAIGQLAGGVAHDFNNLLTGILGNIGIIRSDLPASSPLAANLIAAETAARQATDLARGLLTFSRKAVVSTVPLNMADTLDATLAILKQSLPATMNIVRDVEQTTWSVRADQAQMAQVILNLAVNARDAMEGRGTFTVSIKNVHVDEDYAHTHSFARTGDFVHLSFADTGPGISDEVREHLFEPFFTTKATGSGTGLGLSIVYGAIKQANGWITVDSSPGRGATFDVFLPRCLAEPPAAGVPGPLATKVCSGTVLVVEDEPVVSTVAQALLKRSGCTVLAAGDGASALALIREHEETVDLILLDMTMPGMSTDDIVQAIRQIDAHVPILLTSGYTSGSTVTEMLTAGTVQGFLPKPYDAELLLNTVARLMHTTEGERR
jgi:PAS domain S-box-containing protein